MTDKLHEVWWDLVLVVLRIVGYFLSFLAGHISAEFLVKGKRAYVQTSNIFVAYVAVKRLKNWGFYAEWEPAK